MKKVLLIGGLGLAGFGFYRYFKYQVNQAVNYGYDIKNFKVLESNNDSVKVELEIEIQNKSAFEVLIKSYNLKLAFKGKQFATSISTNEFKVLPNSSFSLKTIGTINLQESKVAVLPFIMDVLKRKPINIEVSGVIKVKFLGINSTLNFDKQQFTYSADLLKDYNLAKPVESFWKKYPKLKQLIGIN
jgi:LEA14-like dessication related protein